MSVLAEAGTRFGVTTCQSAARTQTCDARGFRAILSIGWTVTFLSQVALGCMDDQRMDRSDVQLLVAARSDPQAFGEFYRRHAIGVERWLRTQTPDLATAADLTAETFAQALVGLKRFHGTSDQQAVAWLFGIARNLVRRFHRRGKAELQMCRRLGIQLDHDADELAQIEAELDARTDATGLADALNTLPDAQRQALQLRVIDELDYRAAAALMGTSEQNARIRVSRALRALCLRLEGITNDRQ
jgi:RNA polymerase sigma factor (sigma-70 family)